MRQPAPVSRRRSSGFTLVEIVIVLVVIAILAAVALPRLTNITDSADRAALQQLAANITASTATNYARSRSFPDNGEDGTADDHFEGNSWIVIGGPLTVARVLTQETDPVWGSLGVPGLDGLENCEPSISDARSGQTIVCDFDWDGEEPDWEEGVTVEVIVAK